MTITEALNLLSWTADELERRSQKMADEYAKMFGKTDFHHDLLFGGFAAIDIRAAVKATEVLENTEKQ